MRLMTKPKRGQKQVWFVIDELASLQKLPQLHTAITESRKSKNPLILGFQGRAQLQDIYGRLSEVMLSQPATKIFMKTGEPEAAKWISEAIGQVEIERLKETKFDGSRSGKNFTLDRQIEPLVIPSEISGLDDRHAYLKLGNNVARFDFDYIDLEALTPAFVPRDSEDDRLRFDRRTFLTLAPKFCGDDPEDEDAEQQAAPIAQIVRPTSIPLLKRPQLAPRRANEQIRLAPPDVGALSQAVPLIAEIHPHHPSSHEERKQLDLSLEL
jgi:type IV secretory pathway TraG/TraD family ATPase VirD4